MDYINKVSDHNPGQKQDKNLENLRKTFIKQLNILLVKSNYSIMCVYNNALNYFTQESLSNNLSPEF